jgi:hypothetical protein
LFFFIYFYYYYSSSSFLSSDCFFSTDSSGSHSVEGKDANIMWCTMPVESRYRTVEIGDGEPDFEIQHYQKQGLRIHVGSDQDYDAKANASVPSFQLRNLLDVHKQQEVKEETSEEISKLRSEYEEKLQRLLRGGSTDGH